MHEFAEPEPFFSWAKPAHVGIFFIQFFLYRAGSHTKHHWRCSFMRKYLAGSKGHPKVLMPHRPFQWPFFPTTWTFILFLTAAKRANEDTHTRRSCVTPKRASPARCYNNAHALARPASILSSWENNNDNSSSSSSSKKDGEIELAFDALCPPPILHLRSGNFSHFLCSRFCAGIVCLLFVENSFLHYYCG